MKNLLIYISNNPIVVAATILGLFILLSVAIWGYCQPRYEFRMTNSGNTATRFVFDTWSGRSYFTSGVVRDRRFVLVHDARPDYKAK